MVLKLPVKQHLFPPPSREQVERAIYAPVAGMNWQQRLDVLSHKITDMDRLAGVLATGASSGMSQSELKRQIQPVVQNIASSAARIARTEGLRIATSAQREQYAELGDMLAGVQIVATLDENTRPAHAARNGRIYWTARGKRPSITELPILPDEPNCRCYDTPVLHPPEEFENDPVLRAEFQNAAGDAIPDPQVYSQWFDRADTGRRKQAVGVRRYDAVSQKLGTPPQFTDFIDTDGKLLPIDRLKKESALDRQLRLSAVSRQMLHRQELLTKVSRYGFISKDDPGFPASRFHRGITAPVANALKLEGTKSQKSLAQSVLNLIDKIHGDGDLPKIPWRWNSGTKILGSFAHYRVSGEAVSVTVSKVGSYPRITAAHELGHFIDHQGIGSKSFASKNPEFHELFANWKKAVSESESIKSLRALAAGDGVIVRDGARYGIDKVHVSYLLGNEEVFARSYAQWIATKSKNEKMLSELKSTQPKNDGRIEYHSQWTEEDFRPIADALDEMFRNLGWLKS